MVLFLIIPQRSEKDLAGFRTPQRSFQTFEVFLRFYGYILK
jgi:hypothetical protein